MYYKFQTWVQLPCNVIYYITITLKISIIITINTTNTSKVSVIYYITITLKISIILLLLLLLLPPKSM